MNTSGFMMLISMLIQVQQHLISDDLQMWLIHFYTGTFIFQNYRQALERLCIDGEELARLAAHSGLSEADYLRFLDEEREYLDHRPDESLVPAWETDYVKVLEKLAAAKCVHSASSDPDLCV
jgi:hypothetical protein